MSAPSPSRADQLLTRGAQKNLAPLLPPQKPALEGEMIPEATHWNPLGPLRVRGPSAPLCGFCLVRAPTAFRAEAHDFVESAATLYRLPCCPWYFQVAPLTEPHNFPSGNPPLTPCGGRAGNRQRSEEDHEREASGVTESLPSVHRGVPFGQGHGPRLAGPRHYVLRFGSHSKMPPFVVVHCPSLARAV